jgi:glycine cleavage system H protein
MVALFVLLTIIVLLTIDYFVQHAELKKAKATAAVAQWVPAHAAPAIGASAARSPVPIDRMPSGVFVDPCHVWVQLEPSGSLRVGADMIPAALLGRPDRIEVKREGTEVRRGDPIATLTRGARSLTLRSPVDGVVTRVNPVAESTPERIQDDPYGQGWLLWLAPRDLSSALKKMFVAEEATAWARGQLQRLRELLAAGSPADANLVGATLQDGGAPIEGIGEHLDDARWNQVVDAIFPQFS